MQCSSSTLASRYYYKRTATRTCSSNRRPSHSLAPLHTLLAQKSGRWWTLSVMFYSNVHYQGSSISSFLAVGTISNIRPVSKFCASLLLLWVHWHCAQDLLPCTSTYIKIICVSSNKLSSRWRSTTFLQHVCHQVRTWFAVPLKPCDPGSRIQW